MKYEHIAAGTFVNRPNRFIAQALIDGRRFVCHVKNTGRCRELLVPGASLVLEHHPDAAGRGRKTEYSVIGVYKDQALASRQTILINMDSQAPNEAAAEWLQKQPWALNVKREVRYKDSRFDLAFLCEGQPAFMEVKGVTLEKDGTACFPDAPTIRGVKHLTELADAAQNGYPAFVLFVIQMKGVYRFTPNMATHPAFGIALKEARDRGVHVLAYDCLVTPDSMDLDMPVDVDLTPAGTFLHI